MARRATQQEAIFYRLYKLWRARDLKYLPVHELMGEVFIEELEKWGYVSYECSARASEMIRDNPGLLQRQYIVGRSGVKYYGYRLNPQPAPGMIRDPKLKAFHKLLMARMGKPAGQTPGVKEVAKKLSTGDYSEHNREMERVFGPLPPRP